MAFSWFFRGFFVALFCLEKQCSGLFRYFFVVFSWLFRGPRFGQILRVLALEQSVQGMVLVNPFLRFTKATVFLLKSAVLRARVPK